MLTLLSVCREEQQSRKLNIVTGFHLIDSEFQLLVLEGLKDRAIRDIVERIPRERDDTEVQCLFNSTLSFSKRLYASLNVEILKIKLFEPLGDITRKPLLYVRDMTPKSSYEALVKLYQVRPKKIAFHVLFVALDLTWLELFVRLCTVDCGAELAQRCAIGTAAGRVHDHVDEQRVRRAAHRARPRAFQVVGIAIIIIVVLIIVERYRRRRRNRKSHRQRATTRDGKDAPVDSGACTPRVGGGDGQWRRVGW